MDQLPQLLSLTRRLGLQLLQAGAHACCHVSRHLARLRAQKRAVSPIQGKQTSQQGLLQSTLTCSASMSLWITALTVAAVAAWERCTCSSAAGGCRDGDRFHACAAPVRTCGARRVVSAGERAARGSHHAPAAGLSQGAPASPRG